MGKTGQAEAIGRQDKFGRHEYKLAQYGLSPSKVEALLERYLSRYEVEREG